MISQQEAVLIAELFYILDMNVRADLHKKRIADERDYVSRLVSSFNYPFGLFNKLLYNNLKFQSKWFSRVNNKTDETRFGCDSMIIFQVDNNVKVGLFEAKWCRIISNPSYNWDYPQKSSKKSHFTDQIIRQSLWSDQAVIWEMFFYEQEVNKFDSPFDLNASTCILHKFAKRLVNKNASLKKLWNNDDLIKLIKSAQTKKFNGENQTNLKDIIYNILCCQYGQPITISPTDSNIYLSPNNNNNESVAIPIIDFESDSQDDQRIEGFMAQTGLSFFQFLKINSQNIEERFL